MAALLGLAACIGLAGPALAEEAKATLTLTSPVSCQVFQRDKGDRAAILVEGTFGKDGVRAVLWHQGESDTLVKTSAETYCERVKTIVEALNKDAGYQLPWLVAQASFHPGSQAPAQEAVANGQQLLWAKGICFQGPVTDDLLGKEYRHDGVHFNQTGLAKHAERWFDALSQAFKWNSR
ncbi:MAG: sialate O-acetylesterase [Verrucomicrobiota bacterium]